MRGWIGGKLVREGGLIERGGRLQGGLGFLGFPGIISLVSAPVKCLGELSWPVAALYTIPFSNLIL